jgi:hypothetical protein
VVSAFPSGAALTATNCPAGRILRESGRKIYPGANPGLAVGDTYNGTTVGTTVTSHMWVLVFDSVTGLRGFIDPNGPGFAVYNSDRNAAYVDLGEQTGGPPTRLGQSVFTSGNITTTGGSVIQYKLVTALGTSGASTLTAAQTVGGVVTQTSTGAQALNLPATSALIAAMGSTVGTTCELTYINLAANAVTLTAGDGNTTIVGSAVVNNTSARFIIAIATATTVVVYRS